MTTLLTITAAIAGLCWLENWLAYRSDWAELSCPMPTPDELDAQYPLSGGMQVAPAQGADF